MSDTQVGRITFGTVANPAAWDIGDSSYLTFSSPTEAKRAEDLFTAMQRELAEKAEECEELKETITLALDAERLRAEGKPVPVQYLTDKLRAALREAK